VIRVVLKGVLGRKLRAALTAFAIVLGVAMISGSLILTDTVSKSFDGVYSQSYKDSDAVVSSRAAIADSSGRPPAFAADVLQKVQGVAGVLEAQGAVEDEARLVNQYGHAIGAVGSGLAVGLDGSATSLSPYELASGHWPAGDSQIAIDKATAKEHHFAVGDTVGAFADGPVKKYKVCGLVGFGNEDTIAG